MTEHSDVSDSSQERVAQVVWAAHILGYLSKAEILRRPPSLDTTSNYEEEEHEHHGVERDTESEIATTLAGSVGMIQKKVLDCVAQIFSPSKDWYHITATAMRNGEGFVGIDLVRNDCFYTDNGNDLLQGDPPEFVLESPEADLCAAMTQCLSAANQTDSCDNPPSSLVEFERSAIAYAASRIDYCVRELQTLTASPGGHRQEVYGQEGLHVIPELTEWKAIEDLLHQQNTATAHIRELIVRRTYGFTSSINCYMLILYIFETSNGSKIWTVLQFLSRLLADVRMLWRLAGLNPEYRDIRIRPVRRTEKTNIGPQHQVDITIAWTRLNSGAPLKQDLQILERFRESFQSDCSKANSLHVEMQLLDYYESDARRPSIPYFGCSRKSCYLCENLFRSLPSPIAVRGLHGLCYSDWGVPCPTSSEIAAALDTFKDRIVLKIKRLLYHERKLLIVPVPHSYDEISLRGSRRTNHGVARSSSVGTSVPDSHAQALSSIRGVKISCYGEEILHGSEPFTSVDVPGSHPARRYLEVQDGSVSRISQLLGVPLRLWQYPDVETWIDPPEWKYAIYADTNLNADFLMIETDIKSPTWGWVPRHSDAGLGNVLAIREDEQDVDVDYLKLICQFIRTKLQPMIGDALGRGTMYRTKEDVRDFMTKENLERFREEMMKG